MKDRIYGQIGTSGESRILHSAKEILWKDAWRVLPPGLGRPPVAFDLLGRLATFCVL